MPSGTGLPAYALDGNPFDSEVRENLPPFDEAIACIADDGLDLDSLAYTVFPLVSPELLPDAHELHERHAELVTRDEAWWACRSAASPVQVRQSTTAPDVGTPTDYACMC